MVKTSVRLLQVTISQVYTTLTDQLSYVCLVSCRTLAAILIPVSLTILIYLKPHQQSHFLFEICLMINFLSVVKLFLLWLLPPLTNLGLHNSSVPSKYMVLWGWGRERERER